MDNPDPQSRSAATALFLSWRGGDRAALDRLLPLVYEQLSVIAHNALSRERIGHTLQTRGLVHEAYMRLIDAEVAFQDRSHFLAVAARTMRQVLVDHLSAYDSRKAQLVELHFFGGLNQEEAAEALGVSIRTVERELRSARALLRHDLQGLPS
jgi:DNA-directed RNA polymerase specialized sigma24 family protein